MTAAEAAALGAEDVLARLGSGPGGLAEDEAARRLRVVGPNAVRSPWVRALSVLARALTGAIFVINVALHKPVLDALLFSLAIAVGISPQMLPAVVSTSLAAAPARFTTRTLRPARQVGPPKGMV